MMQFITPKQPLFRIGTITPSQWRDLGNQARSEIVQRTSRKGEDIDHQPFEPYSPVTIAKKRDIMQSRQRLAPETVTLMDTGQMHRSLAVVVKGQSAELYYSDQNRARVALTHQNGNPYINLPQRTHFGFNDADGAVYARKIGELQIKANQRANR